MLANGECMHAAAEAERLPESNNVTLVKYLTSFFIAILIALLFAVIFMSKITGNDETPDATKLYLRFLEEMEYEIDGGDLYFPVEFKMTDYVVKEGESFIRITERIGLRKGTILSANPDLISNAHLLHPGQVLRIPNRDGVLHVVRENDTLDKLSDEYNTKKSDIKHVNQLPGEELALGDEIFIPNARLPFSIIQKAVNASFLTPLTFYRVTSGFGYRRDPFTGGRRYHKGIDLAAPTGTPVFAARGGTVAFAGRKSGYGKVVIIRHEGADFGDFTTYYAHLSRYRVKAGTKVGAGTPIGNVGSTGRSTGPHLHFEVRQGGVSINPRIACPDLLSQN